MKYHNVYYYCGILSNIIEYQQEEFLTKLWEFSHGYLEAIPKDFSKISVLILFCRWSVKCIMEEDMEKELDEIKYRIEKYSEDRNEALKMAFCRDGSCFSFEVERAIEHYYTKILYLLWKLCRIDADYKSFISSISSGRQIDHFYSIPFAFMNNGNKP